MKLTILASVFALCLSPLALAEDAAAPAAAAGEHKEHGSHDHKHKKNCGHKGEKHAGHVDYEHDGHHHKGHAGHVDECVGPEADAPKAGS